MPLLENFATRSCATGGPVTAGAAIALPAMLADLEELVACESFSADHAALARSAEVVGALGARLLGRAPETIVIDGVPHLRWTFGTPRVLLVGHHDTVWPVGSLQTHPWSLVDGIARGPGVLDMKAGLVQMFHALACLPSPDGVCVLINGDEEAGLPDLPGADRAVRARLRRRLRRGGGRERTGRAQDRP